ncbi:MAG: 16S rRNA (cytidine(1402)-2'-O)-methyltransferase [Chromatiaceae bacterium]|nr:16S rRNA (cytidine(1402)-2'-O)-methyltransferase [Gammaproteobacteria bacterium]MCP5298336.1 16S rRNA (cytidine(1402)-2'-O)-methyltransferase [Chromatiaceae bacterium]MCP5423124.1 16S rRNA (cytidine(1402)-2'-O)-methyltransferase [Chromatiaceae bacterium]
MEQRLRSGWDDEYPKAGHGVSNAGGTLYVVATPIGNRDDITLRAIDVLRRVDHIAAEDTRHSRPLLEHLDIQRPLIALHEHNENSATRRVLDLLAAGESVALISDAGTPLISDPGFPLVRASRALGHAVVPVPGPSALIAALSVAGLPTDRFRFEGFLPRRQPARLALFEALRRETATTVFYESSHRIVEALEDMRTVFGDARQLVLARELTKLHETVLAAPLAQVVVSVGDDPDQRRGEFVLLLAGAEDAGEQCQIAVDDLLRSLLEELPVKQAAALAARISGGRRNNLYRRALELAAAVSGSG